MKTEIIKIDANNIDLNKIRYAAEVIKSGRLVAFPTETVYGLGANALNEKAVNNIFKAKGRPSDNPLILHVSELSHCDKIGRDIHEDVFMLMNSFWPGPLTLVVKKTEAVPDNVSAGLNTVGIRMPSHPVALELIKHANIPVAAPSANRSGRPSPTMAEHVIEDLYGHVDLIIDSGDCNIGVESTVLDTTSDPFMILRPGGVTLEQINELIKDVNIDPTLLTSKMEGLAPKAPGMKYTHYAPKAEVIIVKGEELAVAKKINELIQENKTKGKNIGILLTDETKKYYNEVECISLGSKENLNIVASNLFGALRSFDEKKVDIILAEAVEETGIGLAIMNRMTKAAGYNVLTV